MDKNDILNYVTKTPSNTNRAVLSTMLDSLSQNGGQEDSIFYEATVTLTCSGTNSGVIPHNVADYIFYPVDMQTNTCSGVIYNEETGLDIPSPQSSVHVSTEIKTYKWLILKEQTIAVMENGGQTTDFTVTGNAEVLTEEGMGIVIVSGDCTIDVTGHVVA